MLPGGFSFGDELGSGRVLALKIRYQLGWNLAEFAAQGGLAPLHFAARQGQVESVDALLDTGSDVNLVSEGVKTTALVIATINGHFDLAMHLLDRGADPNLATENGVAPGGSTSSVRPQRPTMTSAGASRA